MSSPAGTDGLDGDEGLVTRYLLLGLAVGRHADGFVDAYYGPAPLASRARSGPLESPGELVSRARGLLADIDAGAPLDDEVGPSGDHTSAEPVRRRWLRAQVVGLWTSARILAGDSMSYADEVEACYGVRPQRYAEEEFVESHARLDEVMPGTGDLRERFGRWRESHAVPPEKLEPALYSLADDLRARTAATFGLPDGESISFELVNGAPWSGFNYFLGDLKSRVAINVDLPVLSTGLAHLVSHEAYPGHHTEHCRKEVGLVRRRHQLEETIFLVGTPQCLLAEGLADLGLEVLLGPRPEAVVAEHLRPLGIRYEADEVALVAAAGQVLGHARANAAFRLHEDGADPSVVADELARWALLSPARARKAIDFLVDPLWRSYITCYVEGVRLCREFTAGRPARFARLLDEQLVPADLTAPQVEAGSSLSSDL
ncbi:MAG: DUF885 domain-containing protein [Actinomycetota bacterium]|nr:DUF885 domain-containing protein [Actinomycetota bacterium]